VMLLEGSNTAQPETLSLGKVFASCGHELTPEEGLGVSVRTRGYTREWDRAVDHQTLCKDCLEYYRKEDALLTEAEAEAWLKGAPDPRS
jgi:hypothetical protein